jgi:hypothetical protein
MKRVLTMMLLMMCVVMFAGAGSPLSTISFDESMKIDAIGDAAVAINLTLTAQQFVNWNQKYGQNQSLLKRDLGKVLSQYDTYDWSVQTDPMERKVSIGVKAHGAVKHKGGGVYEFDVPKDWKGGQHNANSIDYNSLESLGNGAIAQLNSKLILPAECTDIKDDTGEAGQRVVRYTVPMKSTRHYILAIFGGLLMIGGLGFAGLGVIVGIMMGSKPPARPLVTASRAVPAIGAAPQPPQSPQPPPQQNSPPPQSL